jgi:hypothetical protein
MHRMNRLGAIREVDGPGTDSPRSGHGAAPPPGDWSPARAMPMGAAGGRRLWPIGVGVATERIWLFSWDCDGQAVTRSGRCPSRRSSASMSKDIAVEVDVVVLCRRQIGLRRRRSRRIPRCVACRARRRARWWSTLFVAANTDPHSERHTRGSRRHRAALRDSPTTPSRSFPAHHTPSRNVRTDQKRANRQCRAHRASALNRSV